MKNVVLVLLISIALLACKNNSKEDQSTNTAKQEDKVRKELVVVLNFKTNKKDVFRIMLNNIIVDDLQKKNIQIFEEVIPSSAVDKISAKFDPENISNQILINLGNKEVKKVEIENVFVSYGQNQVNIKTPQEMEEYLNFNKFIDRDPSSTTLQTKKVDGRHNPIINLKRSLINLLKKE